MPARLGQALSAQAWAKLKELEARDYRDCDCPIPYPMRKYNPYLGTWTLLRLCCLARQLEALLELPQGTFYQVVEFPPTDTWDWERGAPPPWMQKRMQKKR